MKSMLESWWEDVWSSIWFVSSLCVVGGVLLAVVMLEVDVRVDAVEWLAIVGFTGTADAARGLLSTLAGSLITVISVAFSMTLVAFVQAASQFSSRILKLFTDDKGNQLVLGMYVGTFVYCLLILRSVRSASESGDAGFVPANSVTMAMGLALVCLGLLVYFVHHVLTSLQVSVIVRDIHGKLVAQIEQEFEEAKEYDSGMESMEEVMKKLKSGQTMQVVRSKQAGFVRGWELEKLDEVKGVEWVCLRRQVGEFVIEGGVLAEYAGENDERVAAVLRDVLFVGTDRSIYQDPQYAIRQLVDIALRALSPGVNDPTTAEYVIGYLGDGLGRIGRRAFPKVRWENQHGVTIAMARATWEEYVNLCLDQIRRAASKQVHVLVDLLEMLEALVGVLEDENRIEVVRKNMEVVVGDLEELEVGELVKTWNRRINHL